MDIEKEYERLHRRNIRLGDLRTEEAFRIAQQKLAKELSKYSIRGLESFSWSKNLLLKKRIDTILGELATGLEGSVALGMTRSWNLANQKNDLLTNRYLRNIKLNEDVKSLFFQSNIAVLHEFVNRTEKGMNLSKKVWRMTQSAKDELETYLGHGIATGRSAAAISRDVRGLLQEPDKLFRRVRNKDGKLVPSKAMKKYHPGQGVYRSSFKNAMRLTRTETNIAYRLSDFHRRQQLPFVTGYKVHLSAAHRDFDICDNMVGEYPRTFIFSGWHPNCYCYTTSSMLSKTAFKGYLKTGYVDPKHYTKQLPKGATNYLNSHKKEIIGSKSKPYWVQDNFDTNMKPIASMNFKVPDPVTQMKKTA